VSIEGDEEGLAAVVLKVMRRHVGLGDLHQQKPHIFGEFF